MELALHIADFTWDSGPSALGPTLAQHVRDAEDIGVRRISVMDHFWQIRGVGPAENEMLEAYSALGFIAAHTEHSLLHTLVTGVTYRESALLAKAVTTLDVLSGGRAGLGIGAAWNDEESEGLGFDFPPTSERFERGRDDSHLSADVVGLRGAVRGQVLHVGPHVELTAIAQPTAALSDDRRFR
jgi:alkanesulfonate monooxygenase